MHSCERALNLFSPMSCSILPRRHEQQPYLWYQIHRHLSHVRSAGAVAAAAARCCWFARELMCRSAYMLACIVRRSPSIPQLNICYSHEYMLKYYICTSLGAQIENYLRLPFISYFIWSTWPIYVFNMRITTSTLAASVSPFNNASQTTSFTYRQFISYISRICDFPARRCAMPVNIGR